MAIYLDGSKIAVRGPITFSNVVELTQQGIGLIDSHCQVVDLNEVTEVDSSAVSMLLEWLRIAKMRKLDLHFVNLPENLNSLLKLYGLSGIILPAT